MFKLWVRIRDADGDVSTSQFNFPATFTLTNIEEYAEAFLPLLDAVIHGRIEEAGVTVSITLPGGLKANPAAYCDVQQGALFSWLTNGGFNTSVRLPTFQPEMFGAGSKDVDVEDTDVAAMVTAIISGIEVTGPVTVTPSDYRGDDITALVKGVESFRK